jgi:glycosyltransferase involved in cell wall biosynthesis
MKIAILGTKGIPNNYGGYEQFAEYISQRLVAKGHEVTVYNPSYHKYKEQKFNGVKIIHKASPELILGGAANIIYDYLCLRDALKRNFDIIYEAGYHSAAPAYKILGVKKMKRPVLITNMDGLEWKRTKWNRWVQSIIKKLERVAVNHSPYLISDNIGIQEYLKTNFYKDSFFLPYGADPVINFDSAYLDEYSIGEYKYYMLVARLEPENNIETTIDGHILSGTDFPLLVVGNHSTHYGTFLKQKYPSEKVRFVGGIYSKPKLDALRFYATSYFHGHSVGGTNPSLLEAMACKCFIIAHNNPFNKAVLGDSALYFKDKEEVAKLISQSVQLRASHYSKFQGENYSKIETIYNWDVIVDEHEKLFIDLLKATT